MHLISLEFIQSIGHEQKHLSGFFKLFLFIIFVGLGIRFSMHRLVLPVVHIMIMKLVRTIAIKIKLYKKIKIGKLFPTENSNQFLFYDAMHSCCIFIDMQFFTNLFISF